MSQPEGHPQILELSYASSDDEGDLVAEAALFRAYRFIFGYGLIATIAWLSRMCWYFIQQGYETRWVMELVYANLVGITMAYVSLLAIRKRSKWLKSILWVWFLLVALEPFRAFIVFRWSVAIWQALYRCGDSLALAQIVLLYPLLHGKPTETWIRKLTYFSVLLLIFRTSVWFVHNLYLVLPYPLGAPDLNRNVPLPLPDVGILFCAALLFFFRHRLRRWVICGVAGCYLWYSAGDLAIRSLSYESEYEYFTVSYLNQLASFLKGLAAGLPIWMLIWFAFRFSAAERGALSRRPGLSTPPALADLASNA